MTFRYDVRVAHARPSFVKGLPDAVLCDGGGGGGVGREGGREGATRVPLTCAVVLLQLGARSK